MNLDNFNINNCQSLTEIKENFLYKEIFDELINHVKKVFNILNIDLTNMYIYYQRISDSTSIIAIKVSKGDNYDKDNYMFLGCNPNYYSDKVSCDVYMHADAKSAKQAMNISNYISKDIVNFFEKLENILFKSNLKNIELSLLIPLSEKEKTTNKKGFLTRLFKKQ